MEETRRKLVDKFFDEVGAIFSERETVQTTSVMTQTDLFGISNSSATLTALISGLESRLCQIEPPSLSKRSLCRLELDMLKRTLPESPEVQNYLCERLRSLAVKVNEALDVQEEQGQTIRQWSPSTRSYIYSPSMTTSWVDVTSLVIRGSDLDRFVAKAEKFAGVLRPPFIESNTAYLNFNSVTATLKALSELGIALLRKNDPECWIQIPCYTMLFIRYLNCKDNTSGSYVPLTFQAGVKRRLTNAIEDDRLKKFQALNTQWRQAQNQLR